MNNKAAATSAAIAMADRMVFLLGKKLLFYDNLLLHYSNVITFATCSGGSRGRSADFDFHPTNPARAARARPV
ncbi:hypothetical protein [Achromobacter xylosoxidans]|uniref:hypothetical protein n=1 Tax=Alcaligenes xylosoxydans xylosoxydans TaxID=85698 RepID=UPI0013F4CC60|nr:hypothetical protein [Achromobacter xylosoxidans]